MTTGTHVRIGDVDTYFEDHGTGDPLVLLHGGMLSLDLSFGDLLPALARGRRVIAVEMQGHGRTPDTDREPTLTALAGDVVGLLDHLGLDRADVLGFSLGGLVALELAVRHPQRVDRLVLASVHTRADGYHPEIFDPTQYATSTRMPTPEDFAAMTAEYDRFGVSSFETVATKLQPIVTAPQNWTPEELGAVTATTLVVIGDHDFVRVAHAEEVRDAIPGAALAVVPRATHNALMHRVGVVAPLLEDFLAR